MSATRLIKLSDWEWRTADGKHGVRFYKNPDGWQAETRTPGGWCTFVCRIKDADGYCLPPFESAAEAKKALREYLKVTA